MYFIYNDGHWFVQFERGGGGVSSLPRRKSSRKKGREYQGYVEKYNVENRERGNNVISPVIYLTGCWKEYQASGERGKKMKFQQSLDWIKSMHSWFPIKYQLHCV